MSASQNFNQHCPIPITDYKNILLAHGGGGKLTQQLIQKMFLPMFGNKILNQGHDGARISNIPGEMAMTTDSFVVDPIFFPGGDIGDLAINGTVNDLVCCGAEPLYISLAFILEEGFLLDDLWKIVQSIEMAARKAGVTIVTGDTKVVEKGKGDKIYINTTGLGRVIPGISISPENCQEGDLVIINGPIGDHGIAIMSERAGLTFEPGIKSDTAPLNGMMQDVFRSQPDIHVLRDPTRGGLASSLNEICQSSGTGILLLEDHIEVSESVRGACEIMGFDPLYIANEGKILVILPEKHSRQVLDIMRSHDTGRMSRVIGQVTKNHAGMLYMETSIGTTRIIDMITGEQLPRIC